jgi:hypothetical protein
MLRILPFLLVVLVPAFAAEPDLLDLVPAEMRIVTIEKPSGFRGTPLESAWQAHPFGSDFPMEAVAEVVSAFGVDEQDGESFLLYLLRVDPLVLRGTTDSAIRIERIRDTEIVHLRAKEGRQTMVLGRSVMAWGDRRQVEAAAELFRAGTTASTLPLGVRPRLKSLRKKSLSVTWLLPPKYPYAPGGPTTIADQIEFLAEQAYSTIQWADGWVESSEEFVTDSDENGVRLAGLIREIVLDGLEPDEGTQLSDLLRQYHRNFGESAEVSEEGSSVRLSVLLTPDQFEELRQEVEAELPDPSPPEASEDLLP